MKRKTDVKVKLTDMKVKLIGENGNAFYILGATSKALKKAGYLQEAEDYMAEAMSGDYNHLLSTTAEYVEIV
jgi:hypothetical protein